MAIQICIMYQYQAEEAVNLYTRVIRNSAIHGVQSINAPGKPEDGKPQLIYFSLDGREFLAVNTWREAYPFNYGISLSITCETQAEIDRLWEELSEGGQKEQCGWLRDRFGVSWQIVPALLTRLLDGEDKERIARVNRVVLASQKLVIADLQRAWEGV